MSTQHVELTERQATFIRERVDAGQFRDASEVVGEGLRLLERRQRLERLKLERLRRHVQEGFDEIDRGEFVTITPETLDEFMRSVSATRAGNNS